MNVKLGFPKVVMNIAIYHRYSIYIYIPGLSIVDVSYLVLIKADTGKHNGKSHERG